jgi:predicted metal-dependent phosphoesterase TrpH
MTLTSTLARTVAPASVAAVTLAAAAWLTFAGDAPPKPEPGPAESKPAAPTLKPERYGFLRGNTHVHTNGSGDSDTPVADAVRWYAERGYDFVVVTDHNNVTRFDPGAGSAIKVYAGVEMTANVGLSDAAEGEFGGGCIHMNGLFLADSVAAGFIRDFTPEGSTRVDHYRAEAKAVAAMGGLACLNHPNYTRAADAGVLLRLATDKDHPLRFFEVFNSADKSVNDGDPARKVPSTEQLWDAVLSTGTPLYGMATDDTHNYYDAEPMIKAGLRPRIGDLAWVMVRAKSNTAAALREALSAGDFYGSTGVTLKKLEVTDAAMEIAVAPQEGRTYTIRFVGREGRTLAEEKAESARYAFRGDELYVRAVVADSAGKRAWVQPRMLKGRGSRE